MKKINFKAISQTVLVRIIVEPIKFIFNGILSLELSILNILGAIITGIFRLSVLFKDNFLKFFRILFHVKSGNWKEALNAIGLLLLFPFYKLGELIKNSCNALYTKVRIRQNIRKLRKAVLSTRTLLLGTAISCFVVVATSACQTISFCTTYRGMNYYFGDVFKYATLIITLVIQVGLLLLSNASTNKQRFTLKKKIMLIIFFFISIIFSYTGIMNNQKSPEVEYKQAYKQFYSDYKSIYEDAVSKTSFSPSFDINEIEIAINDIVNKANAQISKLNSMAYDYGTAGLSKYNGLISNNSGQNDMKDFKELTNEETSAQAKISILNTYINELQNKKIDISKIQEAENAKKSLQEIVNIANDDSITNYLTVKSAYESLKNEIISIDNKAQFMDIPKSLGELYQTYYNGKQLHEGMNKCKDYYTIKADVLSDLTGENKTSEDAINIRFNDNKQINNLLYALDNEVQENFIDNQVLKQLIDIKDYDRLLNKANEYLAHSDINFIALKKLNPLDKDFLVAIAVAFVALLVDGLTLLMPLLMEKQKNSILYAKSRKDLVYEEEDLFEELLMNHDMSMLKNDISLEIDKLNKHLEDFKNKLQPIPELEEMGYSMLIKKKDFDDLLKTDYMEFYIFCEQCSYIQFMPNDVFKTALKAKKCIRKINIDEDVYLIEGKFIIWLRQNFRELKGLGKEIK